MSDTEMSLEQARLALKQRLQSLAQAGVQQLPRAKAAANPIQLPPADVPQKAPAESAPHTAGKPAPQATTPQSTQIAQPANPVVKAPVARPQASEPVVAAGAKAEDSPVTPAGSNAPQPAAVSLTLPERVEQLHLLREEVAACTQCEPLAAARTQTVFGSGSPTARLCFLGEAPGADEDRTGEPFVGAAGKMLTDIIEKGMQLQRKDVYILNILKCRPPGNRAPQVAEARNCRRFLVRQLELIQPEFICCLGKSAASYLLELDLAVGRMRGNFYTYEYPGGAAQAMVTYHPSYLIRQRDPAQLKAEKRKVWDDIQMLMQAMGMKD